MQHSRLNFFFLNIGHLYDHLFVLIFATVAALSLSQNWGLSYGELIPYATPGFIAFGVCALPAGWLADKWSRQGMMVVFFLGIGVSSIVTSFAQTPLQIGAGLLIIGMFAAIYHPVGLALVVDGRERTGVPLAINGIFGNLGVAVAALLTGLLIDVMDWRAAFYVPGILSIGTALAYGIFIRSNSNREARSENNKTANKPKSDSSQTEDRNIIIRIFAIMFISTAIGGVIYQSTTFALPKLFAERITDIADTASEIGFYAFIVFAVAGIAQLVVGYFADRHSIRSVFGVVALLQVCFLALVHNMAGLNSVLVAMIVMMAVFGQIPINDILVGRISSPEWRSRIFAFRYIITFSAMAITLPLVAWIHANWGFSTLFLALAAAAIVTLISVLNLPRTGRITGKPV
ncbi:MAG: MFS transporter [Rhodospirillaceae bacterium]|jgi:MFS family permease|nr:MFS transporter [Rhodospirillaceae bacterium]